MGPERFEFGALPSRPALFLAMLSVPHRDPLRRHLGRLGPSSQRFGIFGRFESSSDIFASYLSRPGRHRRSSLLSCVDGHFAAGHRGRTDRFGIVGAGGRTWASQRWSMFPPTVAVDTMA